MKKSNSAKKLKVDKNFTPCPIEDGDEFYPNGIFEFNITKMIEYIKSMDAIKPIQIKVSDFPNHFSTPNESYLESVVVGEPIIIAEISPGNYNVIDGNHRLEKARRLGMDKISAYSLSPDQHIAFLSEKRAYLAYVDYWNKKLRDWCNKKNFHFFAFLKKCDKLEMYLFII